MKFTFRSSGQTIGRNYVIDYSDDGRLDPGNFAGALNKIHRATGEFSAQQLKQPADAATRGTDADVLVVFNGLEHEPPLTDAAVFQSIVDTAMRAEMGEDIIVDGGRLED